MDGLDNISKRALKTNELGMAKDHCRVNEWLSTVAVFREYWMIFPDICQGSTWTIAELKHLLPCSVSIHSLR